MGARPGRSRLADDVCRNRSRTLDKARFQTFDLAFLGSSMRRLPPPWTAEKIKAGSR